MVNDILISASIGAIFAIIVNLIFFIYTTYIRNKRDFLRSQINDLLLPLYIHFHHINSENINSGEDFRENSEAFVKVLLEDTEIEKIVSKNLYLASPDLSNILLQFLNLQYDYEFELNANSDSEYILDNYVKLRDAINKEYREKVKLYQKNY